ncbi:MAG: tetratricopeptide repeat protein [Polyangiaceae bacterium]
MRVWGLVRGVAAVAVASAPLIVGSTLAWADAPPAFPPCSKEPSPADVEGAAGSHRAAKAYYERGEYDKAVQLWRDAYSFDCSKPAVFLNMANAYEKKGDTAAAVAMLETYLARVPKDAPDVGTISAKVQNLKASLKSEPVAPVTPAVTTAPTTAPAPTSTGPDTLPPPSGARPYGVAPWIVTGVGVAALGAGVVVAIIGNGKVSDAEEQCTGRKSCPTPVADSGNTGRSMVTAGIIVAGVGAAAVTGGLIWQLGFNHPASSEAAARPERGVRVAPLLSPAQQGVLVTGRF